MKVRILTIVLSLLLISGCTATDTASKVVDTAVDSVVDNTQLIETAKTEILDFAHNLDSFSKEFVTAEFVDWIYDEFGEAVLFKLCDTLKSGTMPQDGWHDITGNTAVVLYDMYSGALDKNSENYRSDIKLIESDGNDTVIRIVGDVSLAENWKIMPKIKSREKGIYGVLSKDTVSLLKNADIFLLNNEFTISTRGKPLKNKAFTFRADPECTKYLHDMGADIVSLANNHAYDFGADAFADTLETLSGADMPYIGAGKNIIEAAKPYYFIVNGRKYAFSAATKAEKNIRTPEAVKIHRA